MSFKPGVVIRNIHTGKPMLVVKSYPGAILVADLQDKQDPTPLMALLQRDFLQWVDEKKLQIKEKKRDSWQEEPTITWKVAITI